MTKSNRLQALERAGNRCERCDQRHSWGGRALCVHHKDRCITNNVPANLEVLCRACHAKEHAAERVGPLPRRQRTPELQAERRRIGAELRAARRKAGLTQEVVAGHLRISTWRISRAEFGLGPFPEGFPARYLQAVDTLSAPTPLAAT